MVHQHSLVVELLRLRRVCRGIQECLQRTGEEREREDDCSIDIVSQASSSNQAPVYS